MYIGDVYIPAVTELSLDAQERVVKQFKALGLDHTVTVSFPPSDTRKATVSIALYAESPKSANDFAEDVLALLREAGYNYIDFADHRGLLEVQGVDIPLPATSQLLREGTIHGLFLPDAHYVRRIKTSPSVLTNDFSLTLSSEGVDSIVWLPSGASVVRGGDGITYTRTTKDGSIIGVLAETTTYVDFDGCDEYSVGEVVVWDENDTATEANWKRVYNIDHTFGGDCVIENGLIRLRLREGATERSVLYVYRSGAWQQVGELIGYDGSGTYAYFDITHIKKITPDEVVVEGEFNDGTTYKEVEITLQRGSYLVRVRAVDDVNVWLDSLTGRRLAYVEGDTVVDAWAEASSAWNDGGDTDNYAVAFASGTADDLAILASTESTIQAYADATSDIITGLGASLAANQYAFVGAVPFGYELFREAEDMSIGAGATTVSDGTASGGEKVQLDARAEYVHWLRQVDAGTTYPILPQGTYRAIWRARDSAQVSGDFHPFVWNQTDGVAVAATTLTLTPSWGCYGLDFTLDGDDSGDVIEIDCDKSTTAPNTIDVDCCLLVPLSIPTGRTGARDLAHQALVRQYMRRQVAQR